MCLKLVVRHPERVLEKGSFFNCEYIITHNGNGIRCGYVKVKKGHPWHGLDKDEIKCLAHGGVTLAEADVPCPAEGDDSGYWVGFDCGHYGRDTHDLTLPITPSTIGLFLPVEFCGEKCHVWTLDEVREMCQLICLQAELANIIGRNISITAETFGRILADSANER
jgi:hypothetical protein